MLKNIYNYFGLRVEFRPLFIGYQKLISSIEKIGVSMITETNKQETILQEHKKKQQKYYMSFSRILGALETSVIICYLVFGQMVFYPLDI